MELTAARLNHTGTELDARTAFLQALREDVRLPEPEKSRFVSDFRALLDYYAATGLSEAAALQCIGPRPLEGFYCLQGLADHFHNLFTDAYFPHTETRFNQNVWRSDAHLTSAVVPCVLQAALDMVLPHFPLFSTTLRRGLFWFDLWGIRTHLAVTPLRSRPGAPLRSTRGRPLFRVQYSGDAIVVECRHALADGNGCILFTRALARMYLHLLGTPLPPAVPVGIHCDARRFPTFQDVYGIPDHRRVPPSLKATRARHLAGRATRLQPAGYAAIQLPANRLVAFSREKGVTVTALLSAVILQCARDCLNPRERRGRVKLAVPVNLHQHFPLDTLRNYSMYVNLELEPEAITDLDTVLSQASEQLAEQNTRENVGSMVGGFLTKALHPVGRFMPNPLKWAVLSAARILFLERRTMTLIFSNLGIVPEEFGGGVTRIGVGLSPVKPIRRKVTLTTLGDAAQLTITKTTADRAFEDCLLRRLNALGLAAAEVPV